MKLCHSIASLSPIFLREVREKPFSTILSYKREKCFYFISFFYFINDSELFQDHVFQLWLPKDAIFDMWQSCGNCFVAIPTYNTINCSQPEIAWINMMGRYKTFTEYSQVTCKILELGVLSARGVHWCVDTVG